MNFKKTYQVLWTGKLIPKREEALRSTCRNVLPVIVYTKNINFYGTNRPNQDLTLSSMVTAFVSVQSRVDYEVTLGSSKYQVIANGEGVQLLSLGIAEGNEKSIEMSFSPRPLEQNCNRCGGTGRCHVCNGTGKVDDHECSICNGTGRCYYCGGDGDLWN